MNNTIATISTNPNLNSNVMQNNNNLMSGHNHLDELSSIKQEPPHQLQQQQLPNLVNLPETVGGSQTRKYLNQNIVPHLLNGMRLIATEKPQDPLRVLGEYLIKQSESSKN